MTCALDNGTAIPLRNVIRKGEPPLSAAFSLAGRTAVVTGAAGLLGRSHVLALRAAGAQVVAADLDEPGVRRVAEEADAGERVRVLASRVDVTDPASVRELCDFALRELDRVDVLVHDAAIDDRFDPAAGPEASRPDRYGVDRFRRSLEVNVTGAFLCAQAFGAEMASRSGGSIVLVASTYGIVAPDQRLYRRPDGVQAFHKSPAYPAAKGAVLALVRYFAAAWGAAGVRVNALSPGGVENGQEAWFVDAYAGRTPMGRMARADELEGAVVFLASDASSYVTGANVVVDGGWTAW